MKEPASYDVVNPLWLRGREYGVAEERERIIALLEEEEVLRDLNDNLRNSIMALIKGEN